MIKCCYRKMLCCQSISVFQSTEIMFLCIKYQQATPNGKITNFFWNSKIIVMPINTENKILTVYVSDQHSEGDFLVILRKWKFYPFAIVNHITVRTPQTSGAQPYFQGTTFTRSNIFGGCNQQFTLKWCTVSPVGFHWMQNNITYIMICIHTH